MKILKFETPPGRRECFINVAQVAAVGPCFCRLDVGFFEGTTIMLKNGGEVKVYGSVMDIMTILKLKFLRFEVLSNKQDCFVDVKEVAAVVPCFVDVHRFEGTTIILSGGGKVSVHGSPNKIYEKVKLY